MTFGTKQCGQFRECRQLAEAQTREVSLYVCVGMYRSIPGTGTVLAELNCSTWNFHPVLLPAQDYGKTLKEAGFADVSAQDRTEQFTAILKEELDRFTKEKGNFLQVSM